MLDGMTNIKASEVLKELKDYTEDLPHYSPDEVAEALDMAIKVLGQQSTDVKIYLKRREENYVEYNVEWFLKNWELELEILSGGKIKPTDAVSRSDLMKLYKEWQPRLATNVYEFGQALADLPPVIPQRPKGKWIGCKCSKCNYEVMEWNKNNYCPNCGAEMEINKE